VSAVTAIFSEEGCSSAQCHTDATESSVLGVLQADFSLARVDDLIARQTRHTAIAVLLSLILGTLAAWWMTDRLLGRRIRALREGARRIAAQAYSFRFEDSMGDGLAHVVGVFDSMTSELSSTISELTSARSHLQVIVENSADSIITVDPDGIIKTFNSGAEQMLGYEREEVIGGRIETLFHDPSERDAAVAQLEETEHVRNYFTRFVTKEGDVRDVILTLSRLHAPDGTSIGTMGISKDVTRELELQREVLRSQRMAALGQAITGIQHTIKNILNVMKGGAYMVRLGFQKDSWEVLTEGWVMVQQGINDMTDMSKSMMDFARTRKLNIKDVDLAELTETIRRLSEVKVKNSGVALEVDVAQDLPQVQCDGEMIRSVVMDLLGNALDACSWKEYEDGDAPRVTIRVQRATEDGHVQIEVSDNGEGMTEEVKKRVFTPFFSTKKKKGTGMGLAVVTRIVNSHEGLTSLDSEPGEGATFKVLLPIQGPTFREE
jgi:PAS domain S-box-containing protein